MNITKKNGETVRAYLTKGNWISIVGIIISVLITLFTPAVLAYNSITNQQATFKQNFKDIDKDIKATNTRMDRMESRHELRHKEIRELIIERTAK